VRRHRAPGPGRIRTPGFQARGPRLRGGSARLGRLLVLDAVEDFRAGHENRRGAGQEQQLAPDARKAVQVDAAALDRTQRQRVDDQKGLQTGLDDKQAAHFSEHSLPRYVYVFISNHHARPASVRKTVVNRRAACKPRRHLPDISALIL